MQKDMYGSDPTGKVSKSGRGTAPDLFVDEAGKKGFMAVGFSRPGPPPFLDHFRKWIGENKHGKMKWLESHEEIRADPVKLMQGCNTVISLAYPYSLKKPTSIDGFTTARYAEPHRADYHLRLKELAGHLSRFLSTLFPGTDSRICVDSAPILERGLAQRSGIGFIGKNNMLIIPDYGSYFFLAEILTSAFIPLQDRPPMENQCGACNLCIEACPTGALEAPFTMDASKCLSYLTIENRSEVSSGTGGMMGKCFFGCDICQEVCPYNKKATDMELSLPSTDTILAMDPSGFKEVFGKTAFARAGLEKLKSNIRAAKRARPPGGETTRDLFLNT